MLRVERHTNQSRIFFSKSFVVIDGCEHALVRSKKNPEVKSTRIQNFSN
jgi:hypothetical protein